MVLQNGGSVPETCPLKSLLSRGPKSPSCSLLLGSCSPLNGTESRTQFETPASPQYSIVTNRRPHSWRYLPLICLPHAQKPSKQPPIQRPTKKQSRDSSLFPSTNPDWCWRPSTQKHWGLCIRSRYKCLNSSCLQHNRRRAAVSCSRYSLFGVLAEHLNVTAVVEWMVGVEYRGPHMAYAV